MSDKKSYQQILKTTSLFGGVQFFSILMSIVRTKLIAVFIGPAGMGIIALLNSTLGVLSSVSGFGIETSSVKNISENYKNDDLKTVSKTIQIVKKIVFFTGIFGMAITLAFSKVLSIIAFGDSSQTFAFAILSVTVLFKQLSSGQLAVLQGLRSFRFLAKANLFGNLFGLLFSIPLYYFLKIDAILPTIIIASFSALIFSFYYSNKVKFEKEKIDKSTLFLEGKTIVKLGFMLTISSVLTLLSSYLIQIYIGKTGGLEQVGFYNAGFTLLNSYVGIIFTVMSTDYFPKLASINADNEKVRTSVEQQAFVSILIITPIIALFLVLSSIIVKVIYSNKFDAILPMITIGILGMLFRAVSWSIGFILIAKGDSKMFVKTAIGFNILFLIMNIAGYYFYGLEGLGFSFCLYFFFHFIGLKIITKKRYNFYFENDFYKIYLVCFLICISVFLIKYVEIPVLKYSMMALFVLISFAFSLYQINKKINLKEIFTSFAERKKDKND
ncbi:Membrane protein involved in the export of O-antigen and teichoic acid [Flavobacterium resistens]|uniref:Membrane protein involved in the export of O-antigen and teichoic acid n=1 Tax=Flavobacterium resistens TaxID=443612 RepID=A0A521BJQ8_9FLAO|nr:O-antigen translocase [Flavobacterium resistens]MRX67435.1 oligosaccharide flippase family protein [Flavobacterium resistens]SMO47335.1 Membrane protein involved in the export of O-antigen and teichoic acid [Flavobacterium resistens]